MKDNYKLLNDVKMDLDKYTDLEIDNKEKLKKELRSKIESKKKVSKVLISAAGVGIIAAGIIGIGVINPSLADSIPIVYDVFRELNHKLKLGYIDYDDIQPIGVSQTSNGTTITIEEAVSDGTNVFLTYSIKSDEKLPRSGNHIPEEYRTQSLDIGDLMFYGNTKTRSKGLDIVGSIHRSGYFKDDYNFIGMVHYMVQNSDFNIPDSINIELDIDSIGYPELDYEDMIKGNWKFNVNVDTKSNVKTIDINKSNGDYKINSITVSKYSMVVDYEMPKSFPATKKEDKNDIVKMVQVDLDNFFEAYSQEPTVESVKRDKDYYRIENDSIRSRAHIILHPIYIKGEPKELTLTFKEMKKVHDESNGYELEEVSDSKKVVITTKIDK